MIISDVTVLMPCFNEGERLHQKLCNLLYLEQPPARILLLDDGSTDDTLEIAYSFLSKTDSLIILRHPTNLGLHCACTTLLSQPITTKWFVITTPSDRLANQYFAYISIASRQHPDADLIFSDSIVSSDYTDIIENCPIINSSVYSYNKNIGPGPLSFIADNGHRFPSSNTVAYQTCYQELARHILAKKNLGSLIDIVLLAFIFSNSNSVVYVKQPLAFFKLDLQSEGQELARDLNLLVAFILILRLLLLRQIKLAPFCILFKNILRIFLLNLFGKILLVSK
ncbi:MAG: glycosyltransferase family 2 protein [Betaproteobacteria bacterium]|nr:glycosyltransferase family 2 protein [Betaproteobacteria bacterium]